MFAPMLVPLRKSCLPITYSCCSCLKNLYKLMIRMANEVLFDFIRLSFIPDINRY